MARNEINDELFNLLRSLLSFITVIYKLYRPYIKCILLALIAYVSFKLGRASIISTLEQSVNKLSHILSTRADYTIFLPERIKNIAKIRKFILFVIIVSAAFWMIVYSFKIKSFRKVKLKYIIISAITMIIALTIFWIYEIMLNLKVQSGRAQDLTINEKLYALQKELGPRAEGLLKIFLCRDQITKRASSPRNVCSKDDCKNYRQLLRQKANGIEYLVNSALNFPWCFICKRRMPFNEFLQFQAEAYISQSIPQEQQIIKRNIFLLQELSRMTQWVKDVSPCNCSQIYWRESLKYIKQYKQREKDIDKGLLLYESKSILRR